MKISYPELFARDSRAAEAGIKANPETAMKDLDKLNRIFFIPESVELDGALKIVKRARLVMSTSSSKGRISTEFSSLSHSSKVKIQL
jgi:hypothetical protein